MKRTVEDARAKEIYSVFRGFTDKLYEDYENDEIPFDTDDITAVAAELTKIYFNDPTIHVVERPAEPIKTIGADAETVDHVPGFRNGVLKL